MAYRIEEDDYGIVHIPTMALYGIQTMRTVQNLSFSTHQLGDYPNYVKALAMVKKAASQANQKAGVLDGTLGTLIERACDQVLVGISPQHFPVDPFQGGGSTGINMNINEVVANLANSLVGRKYGQYSPVHPIDHVNASQSTSDVCHTALRMAILFQSQPLFKRLNELVKALEDKCNQFTGIATISRTCLQDGLRIGLDQKFSAYVAVVKRRWTELEQAVDQLRLVNLGGTVVGSGHGAPEAYRQLVIQKLREVSGLKLARRENLFDAAQNIDDLAYVSTQLKLLSSCLIKLAKDLRLLSSGPEAGFHEVILPPVQSGSSFFPGKINPVIPETLIQCCFQIVGLDRAVQATLEHGELDLNVFEGGAGANILAALTMLEQALAQFTEKCIKGLQANKEKCAQLASGLFPIVADLKAKYGYGVVKEWIKETGKEEIKLQFNKGEIKLEGRE